MPTLTDRDLAILLSVGTGLVLTNREIEWLHFPGWTAREEAHAAIAPATPYSASTSVRRRLGTLCAAGYLDTIPRTLPLRRRTTTRLPHLYALTERGRAILREEQVSYPELKPLGLSLALPVHFFDWHPRRMAY